MPQKIKILFVFAACLMITASAVAEVIRTIETGVDCIPAVTLTDSPNASVKSYAIEESIPYGLTPFNIGSDGVWSDVTHTIKWGAFSDNTFRTFTYDLEGFDGGYTIDGRVSFDGTTEIITGEGSVTIDCAPKQAATPTISPAGGTPVPVTVTMTCATDGAEIRYTINGDTPGTTSSLYTASFELTTAAGVKAKAFKNGMIDSAIATATYPSPPVDYAEISRSVIDDHSCSPEIRLSVAPGANVKSYAIEETIPYGLTPTLATAGVWSPETRTIKWGAFADGTTREFVYTVAGSDGDYIVSGKGSFNGGEDIVIENTTVAVDCPVDVVADPVIEPPDGTNVPVTVTITCDTSGAYIYYTTDGSLPDENATVYTDSFDLTESTVVKAVAVKTSAAPSNVVTATYPDSPVTTVHVKRSVRDNSLCPPMIIELAVTPEETTKSYAVEEVLPPGLSPVNISNDGVWLADSRRIKWGGFIDNYPRILECTIERVTADFTVEGMASLDGFKEMITGKELITVDCDQVKAATPVFDPPAGDRGPLTVTISCATPGAEIHYTTDGDIPTTSSPLYSSPLYLETTTTLKARAFKSGLEESDLVEGLYPLRVPKAIIVAGGYTSNYLWKATRRCAHFAYRELLYKGYKKENIYFLSSEIGVDVDGDGDANNDVDDWANGESLEYAITDWARDASELVLYMIDHGGTGTFLINKDEYVLASDLDTWLDSLQTKMPGHVVFMYDACYSGSFIKEMTPEPGKLRITITSASADESALFLSEGSLSFSFQFWSYIYYGFPIREAFYFGQDMMIRYRNALIDANGNGIPLEKEDIILASNILIGRDFLIASDPPRIRSISSAQCLDGGTSAVISAGDIFTGHSIDRVWGFVIPPNIDDLSEEEKAVGLDEILFQDTDGDGKYSVTYTDFNIDGLYRIVIYAVDRQGYYSKPVETYVVQGMMGKGDVNADGVVDLKDAVISAAISAGYDAPGVVCHDSPSADVNGDGEIGIEEILYGLRSASR